MQILYAGCRISFGNTYGGTGRQSYFKRNERVKEQIDTCPADRTELLESYRKRYAVIEEYAPKMLTAEEVKALILEKFADVVATKNKGMIMKNVMGELKGKADGKVINQIVAELCQ